MARTKVKLERISNDSMRRTTYKKRKNGLIKKICELSILCGVNACMIIYGQEEAQPDVWPSPEDATQLVVRFKSMPPMEQGRKMMNQEGILLQRVSKVQDQLRRLEGDNRDLAARLLMHELVDGWGARTMLDVGLDDAMTVAWMADAKLKAVQERMKAATAGAALLQGESSLSAVVAAPPRTMEEQAKHPMETAMESLQRQNWLVDGVDINPVEEDDGFIFFGDGAAAEEVLPIAYAGPSSDGGPWLHDPCTLFPFN